MSDFKALPTKHPSAKLDYVFDWAPKRNNRGVTNWLKPEESILTKTINITPSGITILSDALIDDSSAIQLVLSGGTLQTTYNVSCSITTDEGREDTRTATILVKNR
jgi:hypothetical protein